MSSTMARIILRRFSAWACSWVVNFSLEILVTPATMWPRPAEVLRDRLDGGQRVLDDVVQQAGDDAGRVQLELGEDVGHLQRVDQVGLARAPDLVAVLAGGEDVGPAQESRHLRRDCTPPTRSRMSSNRRTDRCPHND